MRCAMRCVRPARSYLRRLTGAGLLGFAHGMRLPTQRAVRVCARALCAGRELHAAARSLGRRGPALGFAWPDCTAKWLPRAPQRGGRAGAAAPAVGDGCLHAQNASERLQGGTQVRLRLQWVTEERRGRALCAEVALAGGALSVVGALQDELFNATLDQARSLTLTLILPSQVVPETGVCAPHGGAPRLAPVADGHGLAEAAHAGGGIVRPLGVRMEEALSLARCTCGMV